MRRLGDGARAVEPDRSDAFRTDVDEVEGRVRGFPGARSSALRRMARACIRGLSRGRTRPFAPLTAEAGVARRRAASRCAPPRTRASTHDCATARRHPDSADMAATHVGTKTPEHRRLEEARTGTAPWKAWGPYLSERQWGTVREDYSQDGDAWSYFSHDQARLAPTGGARTVSRGSPMTAAALSRPRAVERR